ncbi:poly(beta-D-mannuronate) C5 epimerase [Azospirillum canadense]|uniref:poly(beta-D-mannuronate) C5 epimerase n=1 Tax=Azospirillum canadense TaxID=403962 RepID=UPI0038735616|nr:Ca2+-binding RTX toxin-like protein [Azospirillum canadense]
MAGSPGVFERVADLTLTGTEAGETLDGGAGRDTISGGGGNDLLRGLTGNDSLSGGTGDDTLDGGSGSDTLTGGAGNDTFLFSPVSSTSGYNSTQIADLAQGDRIDMSGLNAAYIGTGSFTGTYANKGPAQYRLRTDSGVALEVDSDGDGYADRSVYITGAPALQQVAGSPNVFERVPDLTLTGTDGDDALTGGAGADTIGGGGGNDRLLGLAGNDSLTGGAGNDTLDGGVGYDTMTGGAGDDTFLFSTTASYGYATITDFGQSDRIDLSALGATFIGETAFTGTYMNKGPAQVRINATTYNTTLEIDTDGDGFTNRSISLNGGSAIQQVAGSPGIFTMVPDQTVTGTAADESLDGGAGRDTISGGEGNDLLRGLGGNDSLIGGAGNDTLDGGSGSDTLTGGTGNDTYRFASLADVNGDLISDFALGDRIDLTGLGATFIGDSAFTGSSASNGPAQIRVRTYTGQTSLEIDSNGDGYADRYIYVNGGPALREVAGFPGVLERVPDQTLTGTDADDALTGSAGRDTISGGAGNDLLRGQSGSDSLIGGEGDDTLDGGAGTDTMTGGTGNDTYRFVLSDMEGDVITDFAQGDRLDLSTANATFIGSGAFTGSYASNGPAQIRISVNANTTVVEIDSNGDGVSDRTISLTGAPALQPVAGAPGLFERIPDRTFTGTDGNDSLTGSAGRDTISGGAGNDLLLGMNGNDSLSGGTGDDTLDGGAGGDSLTGGAGNDTFRFSSLDDIAEDIITDFAAGDRIDLSALNAVFIGSDRFTGTYANHGPAQVMVSTSNATTYLWIDSNGDGLSDHIITLAGSHTLREVAGSPGVLERVAELTVTGGVGAETLTGGAGRDVISGGGGDDLLDGLADDDVLSGGDGNDTLVSGLGVDTLSGGAGNDIFRFPNGTGTHGYQHAWIVDFAPGDRIDLSDWNATFIGDSAFTGNAVNRAPQVRVRTDAANTMLEIDGDGDGNIDRTIYINGSPGLREVAGSPGVFECVPAQTITGTAAGDTLDGGAGRDTIGGGAGNDLLRGLAGNDSLTGDAGDDILEDGLGSDTLTGGAGNDTFRIVAQPAGTTFSYSIVSSTTITDFAQGDRIDLSALKATFIGETAFSGNNLNGGTGKAEVRLRSDYVGTTMLEVDSNGDGLADRTINLYGSHALVEQAGSPGMLVRVPDRVLTGTAANETLDGGAGGDTISGGAGNDLLRGLGGSDNLSGDAGDDVLSGGPGRDTLTGGEGGDTFRFDGFGDVGGDLITDFAAGDRIDLSALNVTFIGDGTFTGSYPSLGPAQVRYRADVTSTTLEFDSNGDGFVDRTVTLSGAHALGELAGSPGVLVRLDDRSVVGTEGADTLNGGSGFDSLWGGGGNDVLNGLGSGDVLDGGAGDDTLSGGEGADLLIGGEGSDTFRFTASTQLAGDRITDFATGDRIDLSALNVSFIGEDAFTGNSQYPGPGQVRLRTVGDDTQLEFDTTGDGRIDGSIVLSGEHGWPSTPARRAS